MDENSFNAANQPHAHSGPTYGVGILFARMVDTR